MRDSSARADLGSVVATDQEGCPNACYPRPIGMTHCVSRLTSRASGKRYDTTRKPCCVGHHLAEGGIIAHVGSNTSDYRLEPQVFQGNPNSNASVRCDINPGSVLLYRAVGPQISCMS